MYPVKKITILSKSAIAREIHHLSSTLFPVAVIGAFALFIGFDSGNRAPGPGLSGGIGPAPLFHVISLHIRNFTDGEINRNRTGDNGVIPRRGGHFAMISWWSEPGLNRRRMVLQTIALPTELSNHCCLKHLKREETRERMFFVRLQKKLLLFSRGHLHHISSRLRLGKACTNGPLAGCKQPFTYGFYGSTDSKEESVRDS